MGCVKLGEKNYVHLPSVGEETALITQFHTTLADILIHLLHLVGLTIHLTHHLEQMNKSQRISAYSMNPI